MNHFDSNKTLNVINAVNGAFIKYQSEQCRHINSFSYSFIIFAKSVENIRIMVDVECKCDELYTCFE